MKNQSWSEISRYDCHLKAFILSKPCSSFERCNCLWRKHWVPCLFAFLSISGKCPQPCRNGGKCIGKSKCKCSKGYQGDLCSKRKYHIQPSVWVRGNWTNSPLVLSNFIACCLLPGHHSWLSSLTNMFPSCKIKTL
jgi:hypothetical protein